MEHAQPPAGVPAGNALAAVDLPKLLAFAIAQAARARAPYKPAPYPQTVIIGNLEYTQTGQDTATIRSLVPLEKITVDFTIMPDGVIFNNQP
jgi:hypothetical protein